MSDVRARSARRGCASGRRAEHREVSAVHKMEAIEASPGRGVVMPVHARASPAVRLHCDWTAGLLAGLPILFRLPLARVEEAKQNPAAMRSACHGPWTAELAEAAAIRSSA